MENTNNSEKSENQNKSFFSNIPWTYIIMGIIVVIVAFAIKLVIDAIGSVGKPLIDAVGDIGKSAANILNNCEQQYDCTKIGNCDQCKSTTGCSCTTDQKSCVIVSGKDAGGGGWFTPSCALGIGLILYGIASLIMTILPIIAGWKASPNVDKIANAENKPPADVAKELVNETQADVKEIETEHGEKLSPEAKDLIEKTVVESKVSDRLYKAAQNSRSTEDKNTLQELAKENYKTKMNEVQEELQKQTDKLTENEKDTIKNTIEENKPKFEEIE